MNKYKKKLSSFPKVIFAFENTKENEDFALTPYLFLVQPSEGYTNYGIGICWGYYALAIVLSFKVPKNYPTFVNLSKEQKPTENE